MTLDEITERLALPRTTVYYWIKDIPIPRTNRQTEAQLNGTRAMVEKFEAMRIAAYAEGAAEFDALCLVPGFRDFVCMYIGEGYKRNRNQVSLANSDPAVVKLADHWLRRFTRRKVTYQVQYHADQDLDELRAFWGRELGVLPDDICVQRKSNSNQLAGRTWRSAHGVLSVRTSDTLLRARVQAWMDQVRASWIDSIAFGA
jgi:hypothetical protein